MHLKFAVLWVEYLQILTKYLSSRTTSGIWLVLYSVESNTYMCNIIIVLSGLTLCYTTVHTRCQQHGLLSDNKVWRLDVIFSLRFRLSTHFRGGILMTDVGNTATSQSVSVHM